MLHETRSKPHARTHARTNQATCSVDWVARMIRLRRRSRVSTAPVLLAFPLVFPFRSIYLQLESGSVPAPNSATPGPLAGRGSFQPRSPAVRPAAAAAHRQDTRSIDRSAGIGGEQRSVPTPPTRVVELVSRARVRVVSLPACLSLRLPDRSGPAVEYAWTDYR